MVSSGSDSSMGLFANGKSANSMRYHHFQNSLGIRRFQTQPLCWFYLHVPILVGQIQMLVGSFPIKIDLHHFQTDPHCHMVELYLPHKIPHIPLTLQWKSCETVLSFWGPRKISLVGVKEKGLWWFSCSADDWWIRECLWKQFIRDVGSPAPRHASHLPFRATWPHARYEPCESRGWAPRGWVGWSYGCLFYLERHGYVAILMGKFSNKLGSVHGFSSKPCLISDISGWHVFFLQTTNGKIGYVGYGWVGLPHSIDFAQGINAVLVGNTWTIPFKRCWLFCTVQHPFLRHPGFYAFQ